MFGNADRVDFLNGVLRHIGWRSCGHDELEVAKDEDWKAVVLIDILDVGMVL